MFFRSIVHFQVSAGSITATRVGEPAVATVSSAGLAHPRTLMGEFDAVQQAFKQALKQLGFGVWHRLAPITLTHLIPQAEGGYTNVELRAFREAALGAVSATSYLLASHPPLTMSEQAQIRKYVVMTGL
jgi:hypothetical protein